MHINKIIFIINMQKNKFNKTKATADYHKKQVKSSRYFIFGIHSVFSAIANKKRKIYKIYTIKNLKKRIEKEILTNNRENKIEIIIKNNDFISQLQENDSMPHQGIALETQPIKQPEISDIPKLMSPGNNTIVILDQITDPHNMGAIIRSATAFDAIAIIKTKDNSSPHDSSIITKTSCGGSEIIPIITVTNLASTIETLKLMNFWCIGLDGYADEMLSKHNLTGNTAIILGSEGKGMRKLTKEKCDITAKLPISPKMESLNVSNAAAIALYEIHRQCSN